MVAARTNPLLIRMDESSLSSSASGAAPPGNADALMHRSARPDGDRHDSGQGIRGPEQFTRPTGRRDRIVGPVQGSKKHGRGSHRCAAQQLPSTGAPPVPPAAGRRVPVVRWAPVSALLLAVVAAVAPVGMPLRPVAVTRPVGTAATRPACPDQLVPPG